MVIGLTGPTGAGKSSVSQILREWKGVVVIDADQISRQVVQKGKRCLVDLAVEFSPLIIDADGNLNRKKLAQVVFTNKEKLRTLNRIIFPYIVEETEMEIIKAREAGAKAVFLDAPTLYESGADALCDKVVAVISDSARRLQRIIKRDNMTPEEAMHRMNSQNKDEFYTSRADYVIRNNESMVELRLAVLELLNTLGL